MGREFFLPPGPSDEKKSGGRRGAILRKQLIKVAGVSAWAKLYFWTIKSPHIYQNTRGGNAADKKNHKGIIILKETFYGAKNPFICWFRIFILRVWWDPSASSILACMRTALPWCWPPFHDPLYVVFFVKKLLNFKQWSTRSLRTTLIRTINYLNILKEWRQSTWHKEWAYIGNYSNNKYVAHISAQKLNYVRTSGRHSYNKRGWTFDERYQCPPNRSHYTWNSSNVPACHLLWAYTKYHAMLKAEGPDWFLWFSTYLLVYKRVPEVPNSKTL